MVCIPNLLTISASENANKNIISGNIIISDDIAYTKSKISSACICLLKKCSSAKQLSTQRNKSLLPEEDVDVPTRY